MPDLIAPVNFTEKQLLFKFFGLIPELSPSDKLRSDFYVPDTVRHLFHMPRRSWISDTPTSPKNSSTKPGSYYFKSNHGSGTNLRVTFPISPERRRELEQMAKHWITKIHSRKISLWWYETMERNVYLEEDLRMPNGDAPDWKFFVCNGKVELFQVDTGRFGDHTQTVHERDGSYIPQELYYRTGIPVEMPKCLPEMIEVAEAIGRNFDFIRVDMFILHGKPYLGEIGLVPNGATLKIRSPHLDARLGAAWSAPWLGKVAPGFRDGHYGALADHVMAARADRRMAA